MKWTTALRHPLALVGLSALASHAQPIKLSESELLASYSDQLAKLHEMVVETGSSILASGQAAPVPLFPSTSDSSTLKAQLSLKAILTYYEMVSTILAQNFNDILANASELQAVEATMNQQNQNLASDMLSSITASSKYHDLLLKVLIQNSNDILANTPNGQEAEATEQEDQHLTLDILPSMVMSSKYLDTIRKVLVQTGNDILAPSSFEESSADVIKSEYLGHDMDKEY